jgi:hypothetical protein
MAKAAQVNKSAAVREILNRDRNTPAKEILQELSKRGIKVHPNLVYLIKSKMRAQRGRQKREKVLAMGIANPVDLILEVRRLSAEAGGIKRFKQLVDALASN